MSSYIQHSNLQIRANVTQSRRLKSWKMSDLDRIGNYESEIWISKESKFREAHWINVIMFCPYFAVLCSLHSAGAGVFFLGRRQISTTFAHDGRKRKDAPTPRCTFPPCPWSKNARLLLAWVKARPKTSLKSCLVKVGWVGGWSGSLFGLGL